MTFNSHTPKSSHGWLRIIAKAYYWIGWAGLGATSLITIQCLGDIWARLNQTPIKPEYLTSSFLNMFVFIPLGLFPSAMAFLVSFFLEGSTRMTTNSDTQTELLQRLVAAQDEQQRRIRLSESQQKQTETSEFQQLASQQIAQHERHRI